MRFFVLALSVVLLLSLPACATDQPDGHWASGKFPLSVYIFAQDKNVRSYEPRYTELLKQAFSAWQSESNGFASFRVVDRLPADISVMFVDKTQSGRMGHTNSRRIGYKQDLMVKAQITVAAPTSLSDDEILHICEHEIGHALGLSHSTDEGDVMYGQSSSKKFLISAHDVARLYKLYQKDADGVAYRLSPSQAACYSAQIVDFLRMHVCSPPEEITNKISYLSFVVDNDGNVSHAHTMHDRAPMDRYVLSAVARAGPFPRPPIALSRPFKVDVEIKGTYIKLLAGG